MKRRSAAKTDAHSNKQLSQQALGTVRVTRLLGRVVQILSSGRTIIGTRFSAGSYAEIDVGVQPGKLLPKLAATGQAEAYDGSRRGFT